MLNIVPDCGAVKAPYVSIEWIIRDEAAALELHCIAKHVIHGISNIEDAFEKLRPLFESGAVKASSWHGTDPDLSAEDLVHLFGLVATGMGGWN